MCVCVCVSVCVGVCICMHACACMFCTEESLINFFSFVYLSVHYIQYFYF